MGRPSGPAGSALVSRRASTTWIASPDAIASLAARTAASNASRPRLVRGSSDVAGGKTRAIDPAWPPDAVALDAVVADAVAADAVTPAISAADGRAVFSSAS